MKRFYLYRFLGCVALMCGDRQLAGILHRVAIERQLRRLNRCGGGQFTKVLLAAKGKGLVTANEKQKISRAYARLSTAIHGGYVTRQQFMGAIRDTRCLAGLRRAI